MASNNTIVSGYDEHRVGYEAIHLTVAEMARRGQHAALPLNWVGITQQQPQRMPPVIGHAQTQYPQYDIGYFPGVTRVTLPTQVADPAPIADQFLNTSAHTYSMFNAADLPPVLFRIEPPTDVVNGVHLLQVEVPDLVDATTQQPVVNSNGRELRYFSFLPRYVQNDVSGALLEFWFRLDPRLEMNDIRDRMVPDSTGRIPTLNALNMKKTRWRENVAMLAWRDCRTWPVRGDLIRIGTLTMTSICFNTNMFVDLANARFLKPAFSDLACKPNQITGYIDARLPLDFFAQNVVTSIPTRRMMGILVLRWRLQELADALGLGNDPNDWYNLQATYEPIWWNDRTIGGNRFTEEEIVDFADPSDHCTHTQFMIREIGDDQAIGVGRSQRNRRRG